MATAKRRTAKDIVRTEQMGEHTIPFYSITTSDGVDAIVPKYIRRIYSRNRKNGSVTKGWQIAFVREDFGSHNPFFADGEDGPHLSLETAIRGLRRFLKETPDVRRSRLRIRDSKRQMFKTGIAGVRLRWLFKRSRCVYQLFIETRAGAYSPETADLTYAGTEFSITEEGLREAFAKGVKFRRLHISNEMLKGNTFAPLRGRRPKVHVDLKQAFEVLEHQKDLDQDKTYAIVEEKVRKWASIKRRNLIFRGNNIQSTPHQVKGLSVKIPDFVELNGNEWLYEYPLSDGSLYGGSQKLSFDPREDIIEIMTECLFESVMSTPPLPVERLYEETPRYASMPLNVIEEMNRSAH